MRRKTLIISIVAIVLLSAGIAALTFWPQGEPGDTAQGTPPMPDAAARVDLVNMAVEDVESIFFTPLSEEADGAPFWLRREVSDEGFDVVLEADDPIFPGDISRMTAVFTGAISLRNMAVAAENADDEQLQMFGLVSPVMVWNIVRTDGSYERFHLGAEQVVGTGRFARREGSREVVIIPDRQSRLLASSLEELYDITFVPHYVLIDAEAMTHVFDRILLERQDTVIELYRMPPEQHMAAPMGTSMFQMVQPTVGNASDHMVQVAFLEDAINIRPSSVEAVRPTDLSEFGLDTPVRFTLTAGDWERTLLIGNRNADRTGTYVMIEGYDAVLLEREGTYMLLTIDPGVLRARLVWLHNIVDVDSVIFRLEGETRVLRFEHDRENDSLTGFLDDAEISEINARRLYIAALRIIQSGSTDEPIPDAQPDYVITINLLDGDADTLELYALNHSQFLIVQNGENTGFFITRMELHDALVSRFEIVDRGDELPIS